MPRRKKSWLEPVAGGRRMANKAEVHGTERNRASPQAICKLYKHINNDQRVAVKAMGTGPFLDIKCGYLHNTLVTWFTRLYHSGRRGFVVPGRGFIPLTEESVYQILGIPHGDIEVKYEADYNREAELTSNLFPDDGSRPKITSIATAIKNYSEADDRFKKLWLIYIVSTVLAPTTDTRISNKCYPMLADINQTDRLNLCKFVVDQLHEHLSKGKYTKGCLLYCMLRYLDALDCDGVKLELTDTPYRVNAWSKSQVDLIAGLDMLEHDLPSFGNFQLKEEFREEAASTLGLFGGPGGFKTWMKQNTCPSCSENDKLKATTLIHKVASGLDTLLSELVQGLTAPTASNSTKSRRSRRNEIEENDDTSSEDSSSSETDADDVDVERGKKKRTTREEQIDRGNVESPVKAKGRDEAGGTENMIDDPAQREMFGGEVDTTNHRDALETENCDNTPSRHPSTQIDIKSPSGATSHFNLPSDSDMYNSDKNSPTDVVESEGNIQQLDEEIRGSAAGHATRLCELKITRSAESEEASGSTHEEIKRVVAEELGLLEKPCRQQFEERNAHKNLRKHAESTQEVMDKDLTQAQQLGAHVSLKRKHAESTQEVMDKDLTQAQQLGAHVSLKRAAAPVMLSTYQRRHHASRPPAEQAEDS